MSTRWFTLVAQQGTSPVDTTETITGPVAMGMPGCLDAPDLESPIKSAFPCAGYTQEKGKAHVAAVAKGRLTGSDKIGLKVGKVVGTYKMAKHFTVDITDESLAITRNQASIDAEAALDGIYVIRTSVTADRLDASGVVVAYKNLSHLERDWRNIKVDDLDLRPVHHWLADRVRAHVLICMLAEHLTWHLRRALAPLTYTDKQPPTRDNPVAPAQRSAAAARKASRHRDERDQPLRSFRGLLTHLATLSRNDIQYGRDDNAPVVPTLAVPTPTQRRAFEILGAPVPLTLA